MAKKSINASINEAGIFSRLWEDTIILALRDLQWQKAISHEDGLKRPKALLKLDGRAETAIGDAITSVNDRFFIFEFKSDAREAGSELKKPLVRIMKAVAALPEASEERKLFEEDSRAAHHFVFPEHFPEAEHAAGDSGLSQKKTIVATDCYYDAVLAMSKEEYFLSNRVNVVKMLYPKKQVNQVYGLTLYRMAAYIEYLTKRYTEWREQEAASKGADTRGLERVPMKALVCSDAGFFWPCADLSNLEDVVRLLHGNHTTVQVSSHLIASGYPKSLPAFKHGLSEQKSDNSEDSGSALGPAVTKKKLG